MGHAKKNPLFFTDIRPIRDPYLRTFCLQFNDIKYQPVTFYLDEQGNPFNICWNRQRLSREPYAAKAQDVQVPGEEKLAWEAYERVFPILGGEQDPYPNLPFFSLPPLAEDMEAAPMLTWNKKTAEQTLPPAVSSVAPAPAPFREKEFPVPPFSQGGKASRFPGDFLSRGRRALLNHNYALAETCFRKYLNAGHFTESVVGDLVRVYIEQPERVKDAENVLKEYGERVPPEKLLNLKITVYDKMKDDQMLCPLYERAYQLSTTSIKKSHVLGALMRSQVRLGNYKDALQTYERWRTLYQQNRYGADYAKFNAAVPSFDRQRAVCLYYLGEIEEARKISADLIRINPNDTAANDILDGKLDSKIPTPEESEDTYAEQILLFSDDKDISEIPSFVRKKIGDITLGMRQKRHVEGDKYIRSPQEAREDINRLLDRTTSTTRRERSDTLFTACKIILQINQHNDEANFEKANLPRYAGRAMAAWGDVMVNPEINQLDTARMAYLYTIKTLIRFGHKEQDWKNAYDRYLRSFFLGRELTAYIEKQAKTSSRDVVSTDFLRESSLRDEAMPDFLVGILQLLKAMRQNQSRQDRLIQALYTKNGNLCQSLWTHLCAFMEHPQETFSFERYKDMILSAGVTLTKRQEALSERVNDVSNSMKMGGLNDSVLKALNPEKWKMYLTHQDTRYLTLLHQALTTSQAYFKNSNFEIREDCLRTTLQDLRTLLQQIMNEPTEFSYEKLRPKIETMITHFAETQAELYKDSRPDISWQASEESHPLMEDNSIHAEVAVANGEYRQTISSLTVDTARIRSDEIQSVTSGNSIIETLRGGERRGIVLTVCPTLKAKEAGSFTLPLKYSYNYNQSADNTDKKEAEEKFTIVIDSGQFQPFENPFEKYSSGHPIKTTGDDMFYGRDKEMESFVNALLLPTGQMNYGRAITVYGQTRTGKSSLISQAKQKIIDRYGKRVVLWDMENIAEIMSGDDKQSDGNSMFLSKFLFHLLDVGSSALEDNPSVADAAKKRGISLDPPDVLNNPYADVLFFKYLRDVDTLMRETGAIVVLMIDEFTYLHALIKEGKISEDFMKFWKALLQDHAIFAIVVGQDDMPEFMKKYENEFACMKAIKVTYLDEQQALRLMYEPLEKHNPQNKPVFHQDALKELFRLTAGSAFQRVPKSGEMSE